MADKLDRFGVRRPPSPKAMARQGSLTPPTAASCALWCNSVAVGGGESGLVGGQSGRGAADKMLTCSEPVHATRSRDVKNDKILIDLTCASGLLSSLDEIRYDVGSILDRGRRRNPPQPGDSVWRGSLEARPQLCGASIWKTRPNNAGRGNIRLLHSDDSWGYLYLLLLPAPQTVIYVQQSSIAASRKGPRKLVLVHFGQAIGQAEGLTR
jgi:hypothetical protein